MRFDPSHGCSDGDGLKESLDSKPIAKYPETGFDGSCASSGCVGDLLLI